MVDTVTRNVRLEEAQHGVGLAPAIVQLGYDRAYYEGVSLKFTIRYATGSVQFTPPLPEEPTQVDVDKIAQASALAAVAPAAGLQKREIFAAYRKGDEPGLWAKAGLSDKDLELFDNWRGPQLAPLKTIIATQMLFDDMGAVGRHKLLQIVGRLSNQRQVISLPELVPYDRACKAVKRGSSLVAGMIGEAKHREPWHEQ